jgi:TrmH family RNA methyltransferase
MITSLKNQTVKDLTELHTSRGRKNSGLFLVEGPHLVREASEAGYLVKAYTTDDSLDGEEVSEEVMKKICQTNTPVSQIGVCKMLDKHEISNRVLILDGIQDPGNLGTLMRSAKAFDFNTIFLADGSCDIYNDKVIRSSQGSIFKLNFIHGDKIEFIKNLSKTHKVYNTNVRNGKDIRNVDVEEKVAVILGNEGNGVSDEINELPLDSLFINMSNMESLNVGVAGSILMYEVANKK